MKVFLMIHAFQVPYLKKQSLLRISWPLALSLVVLIFSLTLLNGCSDSSSTSMTNENIEEDESDFMLMMDQEQNDLELQDQEVPVDMEAEVMPEITPLDALNLTPVNLSEASFKAQGTLHQIYIWKAPPNTEMEAIDYNGQVIISGTTDEQGSLVFRELEAQEDVIVRVVDQPENRARQIEILSLESSQPTEQFYQSHVLQPGRGYITMRDGTQLSVFVSLPGPIDEGPYPTIINYSGYSPSRPSRPLDDSVEPFCGQLPILCDSPGHPAGLLAGLGGYASVGINMRGTGCSGGAYDFFEELQLVDGYDLVEIIARQPWVKHNHVGMAGLSYPGISQLFVAKMNPPSLAAIAPMSVLADSASSTLAPGGIYNDGFALAWIENVLERALPYGHGWIEEVVRDGDTVCEEHQLLHSQMVDVVAKALANPFYTDEVAALVDPTQFVDEITVPVFLTGQWQDEQTGPHFAALFDRFTSSPQARFTVTNGVHTDGYTPQILMEWKSFLDFYVARQIPSWPPLIRMLIPLFYENSLGASLKLTPNRFAEETSFDEALARYEAEPPLRVIWESGADPEYPAGAPAGRFETFHDAWPLPETEVFALYFHPDGSMTSTPPTQEESENHSASFFYHDPEAETRVIHPRGSISDLQPEWTYNPLHQDRAIAFISAPLEDDHVFLGHGSVDVWLQSSEMDADLEIHLTEVRPDGSETWVQAGWLRASHRTLREDATELRPIKTHREEDYAFLPEGEWTPVRIELMPFGHLFRAGSQIRLSIDTPGDTASEWYFILLDQPETARHAIAHSAVYPSRIVLPLIPSVEIPTALPECNALRGQPCRPYMPIQNLPFTGWDDESSSIDAPTP